MAKDHLNEINSPRDSSEQIHDFGNRTILGNKPQSNEDHIAVFDQIVRSRRSVRVFLPEPLPNQILEHCLECALLAPNSSNLQTWDFYVVDSEAKRKAVNEACLSQPAATTAARIIICVVHPHRWREHASEMHALLESSGAPPSALKYYNKIIPLALRAGPLGSFHLVKKIGVTILGFFKPTPREPTSHADIRVWAHKSAALACENLMLALRANGYDSCPMEGLDSSRLKKILGLARSSEIVMAIGAGKRSPKGIYGPQIRFPKERFIHHI